MSSENLSTPTRNRKVPETPDECLSCGGDRFQPHWLPVAVDLPDDQSDGRSKSLVFAYHSCISCGRVENDRRDELPVHVRDGAPAWREIFGHPEPYTHQVDAIEHVIEMGANNGYAVIEGGCGTGKTQIALTAGLKLVRDPNTRFQRVMVLTSVKQQQRQFEDDIGIINENLRDSVPPASAVTLVGKTDLCPYVRGGGPLDSESIAAECSQLRQQTRSLLDSGRFTGHKLTTTAETSETDSWGVEGVESPYESTIPSLDSRSYCPFYAEYKNRYDLDFRCVDADAAVMRPVDIIRFAVDRGMCPHSAMATLCNRAEVVIANYYHAFEENTLNLTHRLIDDSTFIICDEAHMLVPRVRQVLTEEISLYAVRAAAAEIGRVAAALDESFTETAAKPADTVPPEIAQEALFEEGPGLKPAALTTLYRFLDRLSGATSDYVSEYLDETYPNWQSRLETLPAKIEIPLRDPQSPGETDALTEWGDEIGVPEPVWIHADSVADVVEDALNRSEGTVKERAITDVASLLGEWYERNHANYFREIALVEKSSRHGRGWQRRYEPKLVLQNCKPRPIIGSRLEQFGGGVLMSATLSPMDIYKEVTGLDYLSFNDSRHVSDRTYEVEFPPENRCSVTLDLPAFNHENRGDPSDATPTRRKYAEAILTVASTTPGNVLVCMPSYPEAEWAGSLLRRSDLSAEVLVDESSDEKATQQLKERFFKGPKKILVTSLRGTLTEGVDYDGDRLAGCIVCGVPIANVDSPTTQAIQAAYQKEFDSYKRGFETALTVPAVRKARQALGRVIRGPDDIGVRVLADTRYASADSMNDVRGYLSDSEQTEYDVLESCDMLRTRLQRFWSRHESNPR